MNNFEQQYHDILVNILEHGACKKDRTGTGTYSSFGHLMKIDMSAGFPLLTTKKIHIKSVIGELLWFLQGGDNIRPLLQMGVTIWSEWPYQRFCKANPELTEDDGYTIKEFEKQILADEDFANKWGGLGPVYGSQWVNWNGLGINQIEQAITDLKNNPDSRRIMISAWNPEQLNKQLLPPCHYAFQLWTKELSAIERGLISTAPVRLNHFVVPGVENVQIDKIQNSLAHSCYDSEGVPSRSLSLMFHMRSVDMFLGFPFDVASYGALLHMIAQSVNMVPGELIITTGDTHIYTNHVEQVSTLISRDIRALPKIVLNKNVSDLFSFTMPDISFENYNPHPSIKAAVSV